MSNQSETISSNSHKKWGGFEDAPEEDEDCALDIPIDNLNELIQQAMQPDALGKDVSEDFVSDRIQIKVGCPRVLNTIDLQQYYSHILQMTDDVKQRLGKLGVNEIESVPPAPELPQPVPAKYKPNCLNFIHPLETDFTKGIPQPVPEIDQKTCRVLLRQSILLLLAQIGYTEVLDNTLDTFVDAVDEYYRNLLRILHSKMDCARKGYYTQFCDIYEHSLQDVGVGGFNGIKRYYNHFVIDYETRVYKKCVKARQDLLTLIETPPKPPGTRRRRKQSLEETTDHDFTFGYGSNLESFIPSVASSSTSSRNEVPVLHLPEDDSSYVGDNLYELIPDVEITDGGSNASGTIGGDAKSGAENAAQAGSSGLMGMEMTSERGHTEDSTTGYYDVEDLSNY